jgi:hypothetical protein
MKFHTWLESRDEEFTRHKRHGGRPFSGVDIKLKDNDIILSGHPEFMRPRAEKYLRHLLGLGLDVKMTDERIPRSGLLGLISKKPVIKLTFVNPDDAEYGFEELDKADMPPHLST